jgi:hypothetical protein
MRLQREGGSHGPAHAPDVVHDVLRSAGRPLDAEARSFMEPRFQRDFSNVRVHDGATAARSAAAVNARAYTVGRDVVFGSGQYAPHSVRGRELLAHELSHVAQEAGAEHPARGELRIGSPHAAAERDAETAAAQVVDRAGTRSVRGASSGSGAVLRRSCADGRCDTCAGGRKTLRVTAYFRRRANTAAMTALRKEINGAKTILANCCLDIKFDFDFTRVRGSATMPATKADAGDSSAGLYTDDEKNLGTGATFSAAKGIPMLVLDSVPGSGGGVTVDKAFDPTYRGKGYFVVALFEPSPNNTCNSIAHELWHVGGKLPHDAANGAITACTGNGVSLTYCNVVRALAT